MGQDSQIHRGDFVGQVGNLRPIVNRPAGAWRGFVTKKRSQASLFPGAVRKNCVPFADGFVPGSSNMERENRKMTGGIDGVGVRIITPLGSLRQSVRRLPIFSLSIARTRLRSKTT